MLICKYHVIFVPNEYEHSWDDTNDKLTDRYPPPAHYKDRF